jgi:predicted nucleotidyltransferase
MNLLAEMLSSRTRAEFFRLLFGIDSNAYHLREIERRSGLAIATIGQEANKLEKLGLIRKRKDGNRTYYQANREHPLYKAIHDLVLKTSGLADILRQSLSSAGIKIAFVFGSIATGEEGPESDIDLFIIGDIGLRSLSKLLTKPSRIIGREINPYVMTADEFKKRKIEKEHFVASVLASAKLMIKGSEDEFNRLGE